MKEQIPIDENMSEGLKTAINYLNERNISLDDKIEINFEREPEEDDDDEDFNGYISESDIEDTDVEDDGDDEIVEEEIDVSDLDNMF